MLPPSQSGRPRPSQQEGFCYLNYVWENGGRQILNSVTLAYFYSAFIGLSCFIYSAKTIKPKCRSARVKEDVCSPALGRTPRQSSRNFRLRFSPNISFVKFPIVKKKRTNELFPPPLGRKSKRQNRQDESSVFSLFPAWLGASFREGRDKRPPFCVRQGTFISFSLFVGSLMFATIRPSGPRTPKARL